jgi:hypothetical protein
MATISLNTQIAAPSTQDIFLTAAALVAPLLFALTRIRSSDIHFARSCGGSDHHAADPPRVKRANLFKNSGLLIFAVCLLLFQLANASLLTQISQALPRAVGVCRRSWYPHSSFLRKSSWQFWRLGQDEARLAGAGSLS